MMNNPALRALAALESAIGVVAFVAMSLAMVAQVFWRYVLKTPLVWPYELAIYCFIYMVFIGAATSTRKHTHVAFTLIEQSLPPAVRKALSVLSSLFLIAILAWTLPAAIEQMKFVSQVRSTALSIPWSWVLAAYPLGIGLCALYLCLGTVQLLWHKGAQ